MTVRTSIVLFVFLSAVSVAVFQVLRITVRTMTEYVSSSLLSPPPPPPPRGKDAKAEVLRQVAPLLIRYRIFFFRPCGRSKYSDGAGCTTPNSVIFSLCEQYLAIGVHRHSSRLTWRVSLITCRRAEQTGRATVRPGR